MPKHPQEPKKGKGLPEQELPAPNLVDTVAKNGRWGSVNSIQSGRRRHSHASENDRAHANTPHAMARSSV
jgi:hypothetical protein